MHESYIDITSRIDEEPSWYDANGAPRYGEFTPKRCPNIYADIVFLLLIACQDCGKEFRVQMHSDWFNRTGRAYRPSKAHYGDPPIHGCVGDTMNCEDIEVLEVWKRIDHEWERQPDLEGPIDPPEWKKG